MNWIPVTERLPRSKRRVLIHHHNKTFNHKEVFESNRTYWAKGKWSWTRHDGGTYAPSLITHWRLLPEPPKESN